MPEEELQHFPRGVPLNGGASGLRCRVIPSLRALEKVKHYKARHVVEMSWQEQLDDNRLNCLRHIGDFDDGK
jgi:hypothetical protein